MKRNREEKHSDKQLISAKGMSLLFHYGSNLTYALVVQPLSRETAAVAPLYGVSVYLSGRGLHLFFHIIPLLPSI